MPHRKTLVECFLRGFLVPGAGIEPARIAPLVFETSASTDSAIRAFAHLTQSPMGLLFPLPEGAWLCYWRTKRRLEIRSERVR